MPSAPPRPLLILRVGDTRLALPAADVREILPLLPVWRPPTLPRPLAGFVRVAGAVLPVIDLRRLLEPEAEPAAPDLFAHIVRPHAAGPRQPCLLVDRVEAVITPAPDAIGPVDPAHSRDGAIVAEVAIDGGTVHLLALDRLIDEAERARIASLAQDAQIRAAEWA